VVIQASQRLPVLQKAAAMTILSWTRHGVLILQQVLAVVQSISFIDERVDKPLTSSKNKHKYVNTFSYLISIVAILGKMPKPKHQLISYNILLPVD